MEVFSRSRREDDNEEALKWAALQRLPTYDRLRKGILSGLQGDSNEVDVQNLGYEERKLLLQRLVKVPEEDNEKFLMGLRSRLDR